MNYREGENPQGQSVMKRASEAIKDRLWAVSEMWSRRFIANYSLQTKDSHRINGEIPRRRNLLHIQRCHGAVLTKQWQSLGCGFLNHLSPGGTL